MVDMAEKCIFCEEQIESPNQPRLEENKLCMLEILMEKNPFDKELFMNCPLCKDCDKTILNFFNLKSNLMEVEDEFLNYSNSGNKVNLYEVLVQTGKLKKFANELIKIKVCRTCFKATQVEDYKEIKSLESSLAKLVKTCLPEFNMLLTNNIYLCPECYSDLLQYYHFLLLCLEVIKTRKRTSLSISDPLAIDSEEPEEKRQKVDEDDVFEEPNRLAKSLVIPLDAAPPKRRRGRPRKGEEVNKPGLGSNKSKKKKTSTKNETPKILRSALLGKNDSALKSKQDREIVNNQGYEDTFECQICPDILHSLKDINNHMLSHLNNKEYFCWKCGFECHEFEELQRHYSMHKMGLYKIVKVKTNTVSDEDVGITTNWLDLSIRKYQEKQERKSNQANKQPVSADKPSPNTGKKSGAQCSPPAKTTDCPKSTKYYECQICPGVFGDVPSLRDHILLHEKEQRIMCWKCNLRFTTLASLKDHFKIYHTQDLYKIVNSEVEPSSSAADSTNARKKSAVAKIACPDCPKNFRGINSYMNHTCTPVSPKSVQKISCSTCKKDFHGVDAYKIHNGTLRSTKSNELGDDKVKEEGQEFGCGHCSAVFYSLDDLDEHNCISASTDSINKDGEGSFKKDFVVGRSECSISADLELPECDSAGKNAELEYECSYCLLSFKTVTGLDRHPCKGVPEKTTDTGAVNIQEVKKESLFECLHCISLFENEQELDQHECSNKTAEISQKVSNNDLPVIRVSTDAHSTITSSSVSNIPVIEDSTASFKVPFAKTPPNTADNSMIKLIKSDPDYEDSFLSSDSTIHLGIENYNEIHHGNKVLDNSHANSNKATKKVEVAKSTNVTSQAKVQKPKKISPTEKKEVINRVANMFGVKIIEGKDRNKDQNKDNKYRCVGCDFETSSHKDFLFHYNCCDKALKCPYCSFMTNISEKLEVHSWAVHNIIIYLCSYCRFSTAMEENFKKHVVTHKEFTADMRQTSNSDVEEVVDDDSSTNNSAAAVPNGPFDIEDSIKFGVCRTKKALKSKLREYLEKSKEERRSTKNDNQTGVMKIVVNQGIADTESTISEDPLRLDDSETFQLDNNLVEASTSDQDLLAPVWLVKSSFFNKNVTAQQEAIDKTPPLKENNDKNELIIPDSIVSVPLESAKVKLVTSNMKSESSRKPSDPSGKESEAAICIDYDSESDSEFVESANAKISSVAALAKEVRTVSASEASRLISEGVPVVTESLLAIPVQSATKVTEASDAGKITDNNSSTHSISNNITQENSGNNQNHAVNQTKVGSAKKLPTRSNQKPSEYNVELKDQLNNVNTNSCEIETAKSSQDQGSFRITDEENSSLKHDDKAGGSKENSGSKTDSTTSKNNSRTLVERDLEEEAADSDGSSFFVTDNEESDREDHEISNANSTMSSATKSNLEAAQQSQIPSLPADIEDGVVISDEEDNNTESAHSEQNSVNTNVLENNTSSTKTVNPINSLKTSVSLSSADVNKSTNKMVSNVSIVSNVLVKPSQEVIVEINDSDNDDDGNTTKAPLSGDENTSNKNSLKINREIIKHTYTKMGYFPPVKKPGEKTDVRQEASVSSSKTSTISDQASKSTRKNVSVTTQGANISASKNSYVIIDDDDDVSVDQGDQPETSSAKKDSTLSDVIITRDFSDEAAQEADKDSEDDCVFVSGNEEIQQSKDLGASSASTKESRKKRIKMPPNALGLFISKVKTEIKARYPQMSWKDQREIIMTAWRNMSSEDKWPFQEESRLHRLLFRRENPEIRWNRGKDKKPRLVTPAGIKKPSSTAPLELIEEIILD